MDGKRAVVILHPFGSSDPIPYRSLTFTSDKDQVEIGRASKREARNLTPTDNNGLFDSRVMSRNHATIRACFDKKVFYICDGKSMHGTRVNGKKIPAGEEAPIKTGDMVIFGTEVTRGQDTYPPLSVCCECQWLGFEENKPAGIARVNRPNVATNTFCVPDDDDDDDDDDHVEISGQSAPMQSTVEISSGSEDGSEDGSVVEVCSPITAPSKDFDGGVRTGSQQTPIEVDGEHKSQPLATPRMTPSSNEGALAEAECETREQLDDSGDSEINSLLDYSADDLASPSDDDESESDEDSMSDSSFESDIELSDADGLAAAPGFVQVVPPESLKPAQADTSSVSGKKENVSTHSNAQAVHMPGKKASGELLPDHPADGNIELPGIRGDVMNPNPQSLLEPEVVLAETPGKPIPSAWPSTQQLFGRDFEELLSRGNSTAQYPQPRIERIAHGHDSSLNDFSRPGPCYHDGPFAQSPPPLIMPATSTATGPATGVDTNNPAAATFGNETIPSSSGSRPDTRLRIADIVSSPQPPTQKAPRKRKIADMENGPLVFPHSLLHNSSAFDYNASNESPHVGAESGETCLPDAQPQLDINGIVDPCTQLTTLSEADGAISSDNLPHSEPEAERPSKRLKKSEASNIGSHAATAVVSAVIGAVGTVALLASLPTDYFI